MATSLCLLFLGSVTLRVVRHCLAGWWQLVPSFPFFSVLQIAPLSLNCLPIHYFLLSSTSSLLFSAFGELFRLSNSVFSAELLFDSCL